MKDKLQNFITQLAYLPRTWRLIRAAAPNLTLAWVVLLVIQGLLPTASVYLTRLLVDNLVAAIEHSGDWAYMRPTLMLAITMAGIMILIEVLRNALSWIRTAQAEYVRDYLSSLLHQKSVSVDFAFYETPAYFDRLHRARDDAKSRPLALLESAGGFLQNSITLLTMGTILLPYGVWLPVVLVISTLPALYVVLRFNWRYHRWWERTTTDRRWVGYYDFILTHSFMAAELRLFDLGTHFQSAFQAIRQRLRGEQLAFSRAEGIAQFAAGFLAVMVSGLSLVWIGWRAMQGLATLGDLALFYQAFNKGQSLMRALLQNVGRIYSNTLFLGNLFEFLDLKPQVTDPPAPISPPSTLRRGIHFHNVTFRYPGSERVALQNFNLTIPAGQVIAIVGENGAGKSTLIKLLCRLYDLEAGAITIDGTDIRHFSLEALRRQITVLFQTPVPYQSTAAENIILGDLQANPQESDVQEAACAAGAHEIIERLPQKYNTLLGKWFEGGTDLSGGEWQRIALARAFLRQAPIIILDEPTSFMDSWAEAKWLARFRDLAAGRTAIIITHRFTTAMQADMIHVMHDGAVIESGDHDGLLALGGRYAQSWSAQMRASAPSSIAPAVDYLTA